MRNSTSIRGKRECRWSKCPPGLLRACLLWVMLIMAMFAAACASSNDTITLEVTVGPELEDCVGIAPMKCLVVDGELFYETIEGFDFEKGFTYRLKIERFNACPDEEEPPQDASIYGYRLIEVMSKTSAR